MKKSIFTLLSFVGIIISSLSAKAHNNGQCDASWSRCFSFNSSQADGTYFAGTYYPTQQDIRNYSGLSLAHENSVAVLKPNSVDVVVISKNGPPFIIGTVDSPIGDDVGYSFAREFKLADQVILDGKSSVVLSWYCDPGAVMGPTWYQRKLKVMNLLFKGPTNSATLTSSNMLGVVASKPAPGGCAK